MSAFDDEISEEDGGLLKIGDVFDSKLQRHRIRDKHDYAFIPPVIHYAKTFYKQSTLELFGEEHATSNFISRTHATQVSAHLFLKKLIDEYKSKQLRTCYLFEHVHPYRAPLRNNKNNRVGTTPNAEFEFMESGDGDGSKIKLRQMDKNIEHICKYTDCFGVDDRSDFYIKMAKFLFGGASRGIPTDNSAIMKRQFEKNIIFLEFYRELLISTRSQNRDIYKKYNEILVSTLQTFFIIAACLYNVDETFDDESALLNLTPRAKRSKINPIIGDARKPCDEHLKRFIIKKVEWNIYNNFNIKMKYNKQAQTLVWSSEMNDDVLFETDLYSLRNGSPSSQHLLVNMTNKNPNDTVTYAEYMYDCILELNSILIDGFYLAANARIEYNTCLFLSNNHDKYNVVIFYGGAMHTMFLSEILNSDRVQSFNLTSAFKQPPSAKKLLTWEYDKFLTI